MTRKADLKTINCTSCGAGLDLLGGGRVKLHVCSYCGAALDAQENYMVVRRYTDLPRPESPFRIGMSGTLDGVTFTVIGTLGYEEEWRGKIWHWVDHQLFSPTHGYAYLTVENGHFTFTRRLRSATRPSFLSQGAVEHAETRPVVYSGKERYEYYDTSTAKLTFVEGEFNWRPKVGQRATSITAVSSDAMLEFTQSSTEREINRTTYLPHVETCESFGLTDVPKPQGRHILLSYRPSSNWGFIQIASMVFFALTFAVMILLTATPEKTLLVNQTIERRNLPGEISFDVTQADRLTQITLQADVRNSWAEIDISLSDPEDQPVFEAARTVEFYDGHDADGYWTEGTAKSTLYFRPQIAGEYTIEVELGEAATWKREGEPLKWVNIRVREGVSQVYWMLIPALLFLILGLSRYFLSHLAQVRRMWSSDWTEDD